ncbi:MAG: hypothetical protein GF370_02275, partial [Candidatus Nealsonbacteria bacterium]|nr:hypothetical protein [Candidatus Nealsonbacteria bacterium]
MFQNLRELIKKCFKGTDSSSEESFTEPDYDFLSSTLLSGRWEKIGKKRRAGIRVPLFFVYTRKSAGIGEIPDLKLMIDWCVKTGNSILELLPLNDVGFSFSPYSSESSFALDPMYLSLQDMIYIKGNLQKEVIRLQARFPLSSRVDYGIKGEKLKTLWSVFLTQAEFPPHLKEFVEANSFWLEDYCLFRVLKDLQQQKKWKEWEEGFKDRDEESLQKVKTRYKNSIKFYQWLQWQLYSQLKSVKEYADSKNVLLKGDLPWMVNRDSADVWAYREKYFDLEFAAGAPPDMFSAEGQRWGMPPLKWDNIFADDFSYITHKLQLAQNFYHLFRIDHVVGLFRMWKIPLYIPPEEKGTKGSFEPKEREDWERQGKKILKAMIKSTSMLPCAEDLGSVPFFCYDVLKEIGIPGIRVQRWNKKDLGSKEFKDPKDYS